MFSSGVSRRSVPADTDLSAEGPVLGFCLWNSDSNSDNCLDFLNPYLFQNPVQGNTWLPKPFLAFAGLESHTDDWLCVLEYGSTGICVVFFLICRLNDWCLGGRPQKCVMSLFQR